MTIHINFWLIALVGFSFVAGMVTSSIMTHKANSKEVAVNPYSPECACVHGYHIHGPDKRGEGMRCHNEYCNCQQYAGPPPLDSSLK